MIPFFPQPGQADLDAALETIAAPLIPGNYESPTDMCAYKNKLPKLVKEVNEGG